MADKVKCVRCGETRERLPFAPFPNEVGKRIWSEVCGQCWKEWLQRQQMIINHYGLDLMNDDAQTFLFDNMKGFFFGGGETPTAQIDTSKEGTVKW
jgi:Fe-S cluster biosynthesis and repair protein YggX